MKSSQKLEPRKWPRLIGGSLKPGLAFQLMKTKITNEFDYLVAESQRLVAEAEKILTEARAAGDYYREKVAAKLVEFCRAETDYFRRYVELKLDYPDLAGTIESKRSYLADLITQAKIKYESR